MILSIIHFTYYYILGLYVKNNYTIALIFSILWEIFEYLITKCSITRNLLIKYWFVPQEIWDEDIFNRNRLSDLIFNMLGYHFGNINK